MTSLPAELVQAYRETEFQVLINPPFTLRVGVPSDALLALYREYRVWRSAFLTAWNPGSDLASDAANAHAHRDLLVQLDGLGVRHFPGFGQDPAGQWPGEVSCLALGLTVNQASDLGRAFGQNAIVWAESDAVPRLTLLV